MAATWIWVLVYVVGFVLFQVFLYRYLQRGETTLEQPTPDYGDGDGDEEIRRLPKSASDGTDREGVRCRHCGTYNESEQLYTYCRECTEPLGGTPH